MSWVEEFRSSEHRYRNYVRSDLHIRAPQALRSLERDVPPALLEAAFAFAWDHHGDEWNVTCSAREFDRVALESSETVLHYVVNAMRSDLQPVG